MSAEYSVDEVLEEAANCPHLTKKRAMLEQLANRIEADERAVPVAQGEVVFTGLHIDGSPRYERAAHSHSPDAADSGRVVCPITKRPFFMDIEHPTMGTVATYGGPFDSYTIPEPDEDGCFRSERYDHDAGEWTEGGNPEPLMLVHEDEYNDLHDRANNKAALAAQGQGDGADDADAETLDAIASEIGAEFKHGARAHGLRTIARRIRSAPAASPAGVPDGWMLVPCGPTSAMLEAALMLQGEDAALARAPALLSALLKIYRAMLAAAPSAPEGGEVGL